jgi:sodium-dependent phosphate cotransporter
VSQSAIENPRSKGNAWRIPVVVGILYVFILSINLLGHSFSLFGSDFANKILVTTSNPFLGLFLGILATSLIQSSSTTTAIVVGLVAAGSLSLSNAIPIIMGANIGTTVTNLLVSFAHATRRAEFRRAFSAAVVHDIFNVSTVAILFPLELYFHPIEKSATFLQRGFAGIGGMNLFNPLKYIIDPVISIIERILLLLPYSAAIMAVLSLVLLFASLAMLVQNLRKLIVGRVEVIIDRYLFGKDLTSMLLGAGLTAVVQSSSVTTSMIVPLAGAGILTTRQVYPFTLGANVGTTVTAAIAALATSDPIAVTAAFSHLMFNIFGIGIFYPLKAFPISLAEHIGEFAGQSQSRVFMVIGGFVALFTIPLLVFIFW